MHSFRRLLGINQILKTGIQTYFKNSDANNYDHNLEEKIGLYIITPTYPRPEQLPELTRLSQTLMVCEFIDFTSKFEGVS